MDALLTGFMHGFYAERKISQEEYLPHCCSKELRIIIRIIFVQLSRDAHKLVTPAPNRTLTTDS